MIKIIAFTLNGQSVRAEPDEARTRLWVLPDALGLTSARFACGAGFRIAAQSEGTPLARIG